MNMRLSKSTAELMIVVISVSAIPISLFSPDIPGVLIFLVTANLAVLIYALYQLNLYLNPDSDDPYNSAIRKKHIQLAITNGHDNTPETVTATPEQRTAEDIITAKLKGGIIEKAIDEQFDAMVQTVVKDLFSGYGGISSEIKTKLKEQMNPYIEKHDFAEHNVKLELLLNELINAVTRDQSKIIRNTRILMGLDPIDEITVTSLFDKYCEHIADAIETDGREIDYDDTPTYKAITASATVEDESSYSENIERKTLKLVCEDDEKLNMDIHMIRWTKLSDKEWHISDVTKPSQQDKHRFYRDENTITSLEHPVTALNNLNELEVFLIKLQQDNTTIMIDDTHIEDESIEVTAEPEISLS